MDTGGKDIFFNIFFLRFYLLIFREREEEREGEKHQCVVASRATPNGGLAHNPGMFPDWELNWQPFGFQASTQCTEPRQPGGDYYCLNRESKDQLVKTC